MNVALTPRHKRYITKKVKTGAYGSAGEVIREALRLLEAEDERQRRINRLQIEVEKGFTGPMTRWTRVDADRIRQQISGRSKAR